MANPQAVMRAAQSDKMGGMSGGMMADGMGAGGGMMDKGPEGAGEGLDAMVKTLEGVGAFLKAQGPKGQRAMTHFQALLQEMAALEGGAPEMPGEAPEAEESGRVHESKFPGAVVL